MYFRKKRKKEKNYPTGLGRARGLDPPAPAPHPGPAAIPPGQAHLAKSAMACMATAPPPSACGVHACAPIKGSAEPRTPALGRLPACAEAPPVDESQRRRPARAGELANHRR
jgi:hypothetical protein